MKLRRMDATASYAVVATQQALEDANYPRDGGGRDEVGVVLGTYTAGGQSSSEYLRALHQGGAMGAPALLFSSTVANAPASLAGLEFKLRGPNMTVSQKEASGLAAVVYGTDLLRQGRASAVAVGGIDAIYEVFFKVHDRFGVMSRADTLALCRGPFDRERAGFVMGEGGFVILLEHQPDLASRGCEPYGEVLGTGASSAAVAINQWPDRPEPLARTMRLAIEDAGLSPQDIDVVYASANGTVPLDLVEARALQQVFPSGDPLVTSIKGAVGECGASGAASCVAALLCGAVRQVPPIVGLASVDEATVHLRLARTPQATPGPVVLVNSVGSGGSLFSVVLDVHVGGT